MMMARHEDKQTMGKGGKKGGGVPSTQGLAVSPNSFLLQPLLPRSFATFVLLFRHTVTVCCRKFVDFYDTVVVSTAFPRQTHLSGIYLHPQDNQQRWTRGKLILLDQAHSLCTSWLGGQISEEKC
jgi:hypothetical protein